MIHKGAHVPVGVQHTCMCHMHSRLHQHHNVLCCVLPCTFMVQGRKDAPSSLSYTTKPA